MVSVAFDVSMAPGLCTNRCMPWVYVQIIYLLINCIFLVTFAEFKYQLPDSLPLLGSVINDINIFHSGIQL